MTYEFIYRNLSDSLPSLRTVQRIVLNEYKPVREGEFQFDLLLAHINAYKGPLAVTIGEDATRVISRIDYDHATDRLVGFVLPCDKMGLPICDHFTAVSFEAIQTAFQTGMLAKNVFVYMAQSLSDSVPAYCLACIGTNNKFSADLVLRRWKYIYSECAKRGIRVVSFGADGDPRELKAMQVSLQLACISTKAVVVDKSLSLDAPKLTIPSAWKSWFAVRRPTAVAYIQDTVHIAVKLKSRLLKPSIILPMGRYVAGAHHLRFIQKSFGKDQHGLRERDLNHKDKQNYDAVVRMCSPSVEKALSQVPDSKATRAYLEVIRCISDAFLDKQIDILARVKKAWYAVFFLRYWRHWLLLHSEYTLGNHFITSNAYVCVEVNAHSLVTFAMSLRDTVPSFNQCFYPWLLGSQSCEKMFRTVRSMTPTFSTMINFGVLGLVQRLHRINMLFCLESQSDNTGIVYPRVSSHRKKHGHNNAKSCRVTMLDSEIAKAVEEGKSEAQETFKSLGMADLLKKNDFWKYPPIPKFDEEEYDDEEDEDEEIDESAAVIESIREVNTVTEEEADQIANGIAELKDAGIISADLNTKLQTLHKTVFKRVKDSALPLYTAQTAEVKNAPRKSCKKKSSPSFVPVVHNGEERYIHKVTLVWLFQEGERVSSDRLFRVRTTQPHSNDPHAQKKSNHKTDKEGEPAVCSTLQVGDLCIFLDKEKPKTWKLGRIIKFAYYKEKTKKSQQYASNTVDLTTINRDNIGVLCSWFSPTCRAGTFTAGVCDEIHTYQPGTWYICTLSESCFERGRTEPNTQTSSILPASESEVYLLTEDDITIRTSCLISIDKLVSDKCAALSTTSQSTTAHSSKQPNHARRKETWITQGQIVMTKQERNEIVSGKPLTDLPVNKYQQLLSQNFPKIGGLQSTLLQQGSHPRLKGLLPSDTSRMTLQIIHVRQSHWAAMKVENNAVYIYDSSYTTLSQDTEVTIAKLLHTSDDKISVNIMDTFKQAGASDCALFAMANLTHLALGKDPTKVIFNQAELRSHLVKIFESGTISPFPISKNRRSSVTASKVIEVYCSCRLPDTGSPMVRCDNCKTWYHQSCVSYAEVSPNTPWYCSQCMHTNN